MDSNTKRLSPQQFLTNNNMPDEVHQFQDEFPTLSDISFDLKKNNVYHDSTLSLIKNKNNNVVTELSSTYNTCLNN